MERRAWSVAILPWSGGTPFSLEGADVGCSIELPRPPLSLLRMPILMSCQELIATPPRVRVLGKPSIPAQEVVKS